MTSYDAFLSPLGRNLHESVLRKMGQVIASRSGDLISFAAGYPDPTGFPWDEFRGIAGELLSGKDGSVLQYGPTRGLPRLCEFIASLARERRMRGIGTEQKNYLGLNGVGILKLINQNVFELVLVLMQYLRKSF